MTLKGQEGKYAEKGGAGGMVEASEDDAVVEEGGVEDGEVEEGVVGGVITNTRANNVAIVSSVITKIFNTCQYWTVTTQPFVHMFSGISAYFCLLPISLFICCSTFICFPFLCSIHFVVLFCVQLFVNSVNFSVLILELYSRYFYPITTTIRQSINIIHQTAPSFVFIYEARAYYHHRH